LVNYKAFLCFTNLQLHFRLVLVRCREVDS